MKECEHVTLRSPRMPCPHPNCWRGPPWLKLISPEPLYTPSYIAESKPGDRLSMKVDTYAREKLEVGGELYWGWRKVE